MGANQDEKQIWPMLGHDIRHTGFLTPAPPNRPLNLTATRLTDCEKGFRFNWEDHSAVEENYVLERSTTGAAWTYVAIVSDIPADSTTYKYVVATLTDAYYRIRALRRAPGTGAWILSRPTTVFFGSAT